MERLPEHLKKYIKHRVAYYMMIDNGLRKSLMAELCYRTIFIRDAIWDHWKRYKTREMHPKSGAAKIQIKRFVPAVWLNRKLHGGWYLSLEGYGLLGRYHSGPSTEVFIIPGYAWYESLSWDFDWE